MLRVRTPLCPPRPFSASKCSDTLVGAFAKAKAMRMGTLLAPFSLLLYDMRLWAGAEGGRAELTGTETSGQELGFCVGNPAPGWGPGLCKGGALRVWLSRLDGFSDPKRLHSPKPCSCSELLASGRPADKGPECSCRASSCGVKPSAGTPTAGATSSPSARAKLKRP